MKSKLKLLAIAFLFVSSTLFSQKAFRPGYILTLKNDTIWGFLHYGSDMQNTHKCIYKKDMEAIAQTYTPREINGYRFTGSKYYVSKKFKIDKIDTILFVEFLVKGKANLYYFKDNGRKTGALDIDTFSNETFGDNYLFEKKQDEIILLTKEERTNYRKVTEMTPNHGANIVVKSMNNKYIGAMLYETSDCPELKATIQTMDLNHKSLISVTKKYHEYVCHDNTCIDYTKDVPKKIIKLAPVVSMNCTWISFKQSDTFFGNHKIKGDFNPSVGLLIEIRNPVSNERRSIQFQSEFGKYEHSQYEPGTVPQHLNMKYNYLKEYIGIRYTTPHRIIRPSLQFGLIAGYRFNNDSNYTNDYYYQYNGAIPFTRLFGGLGAGIGADINFSKHLIVFLKATYDYTVGAQSVNVNFSYISNLSLRTGIYL